MDDIRRPEVFLTVLPALAAEADALIQPKKIERENKTFVPVRHTSDGLTSVIQCGIGRDTFLAVAASCLKQTAIVGNIGVSGGLASDMAPGTVILGERILCNGDAGQGSLDKDGYTASQRLLDFLESTLEKNALPCRRGSLLCRQEPLIYSEDKAAAFLKTGALAVDMESAGAAEAARRAGVPFFSIRIICDPVERKLAGELFAGVDRQGNSRPLRLIKPLVRHPWLLVSLLMMARDFSCALASMERVWNVVGQPLVDLAAADSSSARTFKGDFKRL